MSQSNNSNGSGSGSTGTTCTNSSGYITINTGSWGTSSGPFQITFEPTWLDVPILEKEPEPQPKVKRGNAEGYDCIECSDFYPMAELNMPNKTFCCYSCRHGLSTIFKK